MARPRVKQRVARVGGYAQEVDPTDDPAMNATLFGEPMDKVERNYYEGTGKRASALEAIRRARKANRKPPVKE